MNKFKGTFAILFATLLTACAQPEVPTELFYRLQIPAPKTSLSQPIINGIVEVTFSAEGIVDNRNINYSKEESPNEVSGYTYRLWHKPPKVILRDQLISYLRATKAATKVVDTEKRASPDYFINGQIKQLEKIDGENPRAIVSLELALVEAKSNKLLKLGVYDMSINAVSNSVADSVDAMASAVKQIFAKFIKDLEKR